MKRYFQWQLFRLPKHFAQNITRQYFVLTLFLLLCTQTGVLGGMKPLVKKALFRFLLCMIWGIVGGLVFSSIEYRGDQKTKKRLLLLSLNNTLSIKYNMSAQDFNNFTKMAFEALSPAGPRWDIEDGINFAFQTITTVGKSKISKKKKS